MPDLVRIGEGAGGTDAWIPPARDLALRGEPDYLTFECLAERTIALAQTERLHNPAAGFDRVLGRRLEAVLGPCLERGTRIVTNMGAANPLGAGRAALEVAQRLGLPSFQVAVVGGDDVLGKLDPDLVLAETGQRLRDLGDRVVSANAHLGSDPIVAAFEQGTQLVITGRVADPALALGAVRRYDLPQLGAFNFVLEGALAGGVTRSLALDIHGKSLSSVLLELEISLDEATGST